jgi:redox-sensitive bicupin YhaK (pirin superfamily)
MISVRRSDERGYFNHGWLQTHHTFSFADYYDPNYMGFRTLRVINQDTVAPNTGFGMHSHHDMEIITYVLRGVVTHQDSMGNKGSIHPGEIQCMTAGSGVRHGETNQSRTEPLELLQIWILPEREGLTPSYQQLAFKQQQQFRLLVSPEPQQGCVTIHQDVKVFTATMIPQQKRVYTITPNRHVWIQMIKGQIDIDGKTLDAGDGAAVSEQKQLTITAQTDADFLLFDLN